jgi:site-specific recombinase XerD
MGTIAWTAGTGPLAGFADGFRHELARLGHPTGSAKHHLVVMGQLDRWLASERFAAADLSCEIAERFFASRRARGQRRVPTMEALSPLFVYLIGLGVVDHDAMRAPRTVKDDLLDRYRQHLVDARGLMPSTVLRYVRFARRFLSERAHRRGVLIGFEDLASADVHAFMLDAGSRLVVESAKREAADLRALLRFLYLSGLTVTDLGSAMPPVAVWRGTRLPMSMTASQVDAILQSCDRSTSTGRRDYAILVLLARLGLRSGEVAALHLDDFDWRAGELTVRGKARHSDRLPMPIQVGEALADYLRHDRPSCECRNAILTRYAPARPIHPSSITSIVYRACHRSGLARVGGHRLRHALASELLRRGGPLTEIAQVLRHSDLGTTAGYAKIDRITLRGLAQSWPVVR